MSTLSHATCFARSIARLGLAAGLLIGSIHAGSAGEIAASVAAPGSQVQGASQSETGTVPAHATPAPDAPGAMTVVGFGWG